MRALGMLQKSFHGWPNRPPLSRAQADARVPERMQSTRAGWRQIYDVPNARRTGSTSPRNRIMAPVGSRWVWLIRDTRDRSRADPFTTSATGPDAASRATIRQSKMLRALAYRRRSIGVSASSSRSRRGDIVTGGTGIRSAPSRINTSST